MLLQGDVVLLTPASTSEILVKSHREVLDLSVLTTVAPAFDSFLFRVHNERGWNSDKLSSTVTDLFTFLSVDSLLFAPSRSMTTGGNLFKGGGPSS